jgi:RNA polymerase-associated protein
MPVLYEFALSPFVQKVKIALREKGIGFESRNGFDPDHKDEFEQGNPRREVPMLVDGETRICDSTIILDYIDERWSDRPLMPHDPAARADVRLLEELADTRLEALNFCISEVMTFPVREEASAEQVIARSKAQIVKLHEELATLLGAAEYFGGVEPNRADISLFPHLNASRVMKNGPDSGLFADWVKRMHLRPSVAETVAEVKAGVPAFKQLMTSVQSG